MVAARRTPLTTFLDAMRDHGEFGVDTRSLRAYIPSGCEEHPHPVEEVEACRRSFAHFLRHWKFVERESGVVLSFASLWPGQADAVAAMEAHPWLIMLKAGKLGFTELECAFDGWVARFRQPNARVHLFSMGDREAKGLLEIVRFGLDHLPDYMRLPLQDRGAGSDTATQVRYAAGPDDVRTIRSYPAVKNAAIDATATHTHVDELARMAWPEDTWSSIQSTVAPGGTVHVVSRGAGDQNYMGVLYRKAESGESPLHPFFTPWDRRPRYPVKCPACDETFHRTRTETCAGVDEREASDAWYREQEASLATIQLYFFAPRSPEEAMSGDDNEAFVSMAVWDACYEPDLPMLEPGDRTPVVLSLDAAVTNDSFAAAIISRHHQRHEDVALRAFKVWRPEDFPGHTVDFSVVEDWVRLVCLGGCAAGHPHEWRNRPKPREDCAACQQRIYIQPLNVVQITYDRYQLADMMQRISRDEVAWCEEFDQGSLRLEADSALRRLILQRRFTHRVDPSDRDHPVRQHIGNAGVQISAREDSKLRIVKRGKGKIDLAVAISQGAHRALALEI